MWDDMDEYENEEEPKFIGCTWCHTMMRTELLRDEDAPTPPQLALADSDYRRLEFGNQHTRVGLTVVEWQCVKGAAAFYNVTDWTSKVDPWLTLDENLGLMESYGTDHNETTLRETPHPDEYSGDLYGRT